MEEREGVSVFIENIFHPTLWTIGRQECSLFNEFHLVSNLLLYYFTQSRISIKIEAVLARLLACMCVFVMLRCASVYGVQ